MSVPNTGIYRNGLPRVPQRSVQSIISPVHKDKNATMAGPPRVKNGHIQQVIPPTAQLKYTTYDTPINLSNTPLQLSSVP